MDEPAVMSELLAIKTLSLGIKNALGLSPLDVAAAKGNSKVSVWENEGGVFCLFCLWVSVRMHMFWCCAHSCALPCLGRPTPNGTGRTPAA